MNKRGHNTDQIFQFSTINALAEGLYNGEITFRELKKQGSFGIGTVDRLDGEMIGVDGRYYQVTSDMVVHEIPDTSTTPFSVVTDFYAEFEQEPGGISTYESLEDYLLGKFKSSNNMYAIRLQGNFKKIKLRSVPYQERAVRLVEVIPTQTIQEYSNTEGVLVGFYFPSYMASINVVGFHFHYLSNDRSVGGHLLGFSEFDGSVAFDKKTEFKMAMPKASEFESLDLHRTTQTDVDTIERIKE